MRGDAGAVETRAKTRARVSFIAILLEFNRMN
jgi:hypothetical protein